MSNSSPYMEYLSGEVDQIEKQFKLAQGENSKGREPISTGLASMDLILGGGLTPGAWNTFFGLEQSAKSTLAMQVLINSLRYPIPIRALFDFEGSFDPIYFGSMVKKCGIPLSVSQIFGQKGDKGEWIHPPRIRYYPSDTGEKFFDYLAKLERILPDKLYSNGSWWYVYEHTKENRKKLAEMEAAYNKGLFKRYNQFWVPAPNGAPQALLVTDSYPAMLPERHDVDDPNAALAVQARMFSENVPRVKGKMRNKRICIMGINQLRERPMTRYGSPFYEPCGTALKFYSDLRIRMTPRAVPSGDSDEEESVVMEGFDKYRYIHTFSFKNKFFVANQEAWMRIWTQDPSGESFGFDPVYDAWTFLSLTDMIEGSKRKFSIVGHPQFDPSATLNWLAFKQLIVGSKPDKIEMMKELEMKPFDLYRSLFKLLKPTNDGIRSPVYQKYFSGVDEAEEEEPEELDED